MVSAHGSSDTQRASAAAQITLHCIAPSDEDPVWTLFTTGMSLQPMLIPADIVTAAAMTVPNRIELILRIAANDWDGRQPWPLRWLKHLALVPTTHRTWLGASHTIPNGDASVGPLTPLAPGTELSCWLLLPPACLPADADVISSSQGAVALLSMVAIYQDEMNYQLQHEAQYGANKRTLGSGVDALLAKLNALEIDEVMFLQRKNAM